MNSKQFRAEAHRMVDWMADYFEEVEEYPVKPDVEPGEILQQLPASAPEEGEPFNEIFQDFRQIIMPGITHWESPNFMAYFPANKSYPSVLAEMLTATLGAQCMSWVTSPAATELEDRVMEWLREMTGLPSDFSGVIQDTASTSTLVALLMAREQVTGFEVNESGFPSDQTFTVYCSSETHSSIEKDVKIAGFGKQNLRKVKVDRDFAMKPEALEKMIRTDLENGCKPACVVATLGTTGSTAIDPLPEIADICARYDIFLHVDAAYAGTALLLPEYRKMIDGIEQVDSFVFNPHKWMFTNFDCSAFFVRDEAQLVRTFEIIPEYLKTAEDDRVKNYRDWGIQLGRRFRALKLWFVIRNFGVEGIRQKVRRHIQLAQDLQSRIVDSDDFEMLAPLSLNLLCFRYHPSNTSDEEMLNRLNRKLLESVNNTGKLFITHTKLDNKYTLRMVIGNTNVEQRHVDKAWDLINEMAKGL
ncbi:aminotransferase class I/II-fold pyridoxal phosphate-dependent enzyme [Aliifodinibius sp. S!AR15-10]|uniref:pyridoxal phosphate-dependent decarboxylase family protein n=1 Tax=Aliifodinibius sp. S!AR15-10 TaxID=2950437 RepID=UPI0028616542|nr:pyridoxal-dependent decarboxylase [Aliifodinibius sp. S!AR15-10]MDR8394015.1 aminotransferase class I/II-fold pyridoxal phosphate-dependent enzyme [Aliifodinibius sp. S!AR15-10]